MLEDLQLALEIVGTEETTIWCEEEWGGIELGDERLDVWLIDTATKLAAQPTAPINQACEDWADTKASYRLFKNEKVTAEKILSPHQARTQARMAGHRLVLAVQDTTYLNYTSHAKTTGLGPVGTREQNQQGVVMHSTLALTPAGLPVGVLSQETWVRAEGDGGLTEAERKRRPIEEKESYKWLKALEETVALTPPGVQVVTVCDREGDVYELVVQGQALETALLVRTAQDRTLVDDEMDKL